MKRRKKNPEHEIRELILFTENSSTLHNQYMSIMKNLSRKKKRGIYDRVLAAKLWKYWIDEGVKQYNKEILGGGYSLRQNVFTVADRKQAAIEMEKQERENVFSLEYLSNPKRRKTMRKKKRSAKQLANDRRLGRMAKARHAAKRKGRSRVTKKVIKRKTAKRNPHKKVVRRKARKYVVATLIKKRLNFYNGARFQTSILDAAFMSLKSAKMVASDSNRKVAIAPTTATARSIMNTLQGKA